MNYWLFIPFALLIVVFIFGCDRGGKTSCGDADLDDEVELRDEVLHDSGGEEIVEIVEEDIRSEPDIESEIIDAVEDAEDEEDIPPPPSPDRHGMYWVGTYQDSFEIEAWGTYPVIVYFPAIIEGGDQVDRYGAPYPAIAFAGGFASGLLSEVYRWACHHLVTWGYVVVYFRPPNPLSTELQELADGIKGSIDYLQEKNSTSGELLEGMIDENRFGAAGHSFGSMATPVAITQDPRIKTGVSLAPAYLTEEELANPDLSPFVQFVLWFTGSPFGEEVIIILLDALGRLDVPIQFQGASLDGFCPPSSVASCYDEVPDTTVKEIIQINGGNHVFFADDIEGIVQTVMEQLDNDAEISVEEQHRISRKYMTGWFNHYLKDLDYGYYLFGPGAEEDLEAGVLSSLDFNLPP